MARRSAISWSEHWDGTSWSLVQTSNPVGPPADQLDGVDAISSSDVWAVGAAGDGLIEHWDGTAWTIVDSPSLGDGLLTSVSGSSADDVWAVGYDGGRDAVTEHWDGTSWTLVDVPTPGSTSPLSGVYVAASGEAWAVGSHGKPAHTSTYLLHWDGHAWQAQSHADPGDISLVRNLTSISGSSPTDVWAVGDFENAAHVFQTETLHYDGSDWSLVQSPHSINSHLLTGVSVVSPMSAFATGFSSSVGYNLAWNGSRWARSR